MELSELFKEGRKRAGLTQSQLAQKAGVFPSFVNEVESGKRQDPRWRQTTACLQALGLLTLAVPESQGEAK